MPVRTLFDDSNYASTQAADAAAFREAARRIDQNEVEPFDEPGVVHRSTGVTLSFLSIGRKGLSVRGVLFVSPLRFTFIEVIAEPRTVAYRQVRIAFPLDRIFDERLVMIDSLTAGIDFLVDNGVGRKKVASRYRIAMHKRQMAQTCFYLFHHLYQLRYPPTFSLPKSPCARGDHSCLHRIRSVTCCRKHCEAAFAQLGGTGFTGTTAASSEREESESASCRRSTQHVIRSEIFVDLDSADVYRVDWCYIPQRLAVLNPSDGKLYLMEEKIEASPIDATAPAVQGTPQGLRTLRSLISLCKRLP